MPDRLVLYDIPDMINDVKNLPGVVETAPHDFFRKQHIKV
jgi:hypothetical protein